MDSAPVFYIAEGDALHRAGTVHRGHHGVQMETDLRILLRLSDEGVDGPESVAAVDDMDGRGKAGKVDAFVERRIAAADHRHLKTP